MSSSAVREMLDLPSRPASKPPVAKKAKTDSAMRKLDGMQRELYSLLGENTPPISITQHKFKDKPTWKQKTTPWVWSGFHNQARKDDLVLYHWVRGSSHQEDEEYAFAKYNQEIRIPKFDEVDYKEAFTDKGWSFKETAYLFELCRDYDLRWIVIHDRYNYKGDEDGDLEKMEGESDVKEVEKKEEKVNGEDEKDEEEEVEEEEEEEKKEEEQKKEEVEEEEEEEEEKEEKGGDDNMDIDNDEKETQKDKTGKAEKQHDQKEDIKTPNDINQSSQKTAITTTTTTRSVEDLKDRFYTVCRALLKLQQSRSGTSLSPAEEDLYKQMKYSKSNEIQRKAHLENLLKRSPAEIAEEEALVIESRKLEAAAERMLTERAELLRLLDAPQASGSIAQYQSSQGLAQLTSTLLTTDKTRKRKEASSGPPTPTQESADGEFTSSTATPSIAVTATGGASTNTTPITPTKSKPEEKAKQSDVKVKSEKSSTATPSSSVPADKKSSSTTTLTPAQLIHKKLSAKEEAAYGISYHDKLSAGVHLRSSKLTTLKSTTQTKVAAILNELGLPSRPAMPTAKVTAKFETLQQSISVLLEAKRLLDKLDTEVRILKTQHEQSQPK